MWSSISSVVWAAIAEDGKNQWLNNFEFTALTQSYVNNQPTPFLYTGPPSFFLFHKINLKIIDVSLDLISFDNIYRFTSAYLYLFQVNKKVLTYIIITYSSMREQHFERHYSIQNW